MKLSYNPYSAHMRSQVSDVGNRVPASSPTEKELKEFFQRLQEGLTLTASERLNSVHSKLTDFCRAFAKGPFFIDKLWLRNTRMAHFDVASKVATIEIEGPEVGLRYEDLKDVFEANANFSDTSNVATRLEKTFDLLFRVFPERTILLKNRSTVQSVASLAAVFVKTATTRAGNSASGSSSSTS